MAIADPHGALAGWWIGFLLVGSIPFGAGALVLIGRLTDGRWGEAFAPELVPAARLMPLAAAFALPCLIASPLVFPWVAGGSVEPDVRAVWLNPGSFLLRQAVVLGGWILIGVRLDWMGADRWRSGLGLVFYGLAVSICAVDWICALEPPFTNSAQGMLLATAQIAAALAWAALQGVARPARAPAGDLGGLLFAALLGVAYLGFTSFLVGWSGDRPSFASWWLPRTQGWALFAQAAVLSGFLIPSVLLAVHKALGMQTALRWAGASALAGLGLFNLWQAGPAFGFACVLPGVAAVCAQGGVFIAAALHLGGLGRRCTAPAEAM